MIWLLKNLGLTTLGFCIIAGSASIESRLEHIETRLNEVTYKSAALTQLAAAIPERALRRVK